MACPRYIVFTNIPCAFCYFLQHGEMQWKRLVYLAMSFWFEWFCWGRVTFIMHQDMACPSCIVFMKFHVHMCIFYNVLKCGKSEWWMLNCSWTSNGYMCHSHLRIEMQHHPPFVSQAIHPCVFAYFHHRQNIAEGLWNWHPNNCADKQVIFIAVWQIIFFFHAVPPPSVCPYIPLSGKMRWKPDLVF